MSSLQQLLHGYLAAPEDVTGLSSVLDAQASEMPVGATVKLDTAAEWDRQKDRLLVLFAEKTDESIGRALKLLAKMVDTLELYSPTLKGLQEVHGFATEHLEKLVFDQKIGEKHAATAAYLYGQAMAMSILTAEGIAPALDTMLLQGDAPAANIALCVLLGVERSNSPLFESNLPILLRQIQVAAFAHVDRMVPRESLLAAMRLYCPTEKAASCTLILQSVHALLVASLRLCEVDHTKSDGVIWACYIIKHVPMLLRLDLQRHYPTTCNPVDIFSVLSSTFLRCSVLAHEALCGSLPVLTTWSTPAFVAGTQVQRMVAFMLAMCKTPETLVSGMGGLGQLSNVVLHRFEPFMDDVAAVALKALKGPGNGDRHGAQKLLRRLLAALGPMALDSMVEYLRSSAEILLSDIKLLERIATLLPKLAPRIVSTLTEIIDDLIEGRTDAHQHEAVLAALNAFPLTDPELALKAQKLVLWSLNEERGKGPVMAGLQLSVNPSIARLSAVQPLTYRAAQLLLADDPHIVHLALNVLSDPSLASMLDERSCSMILLALHQSIEPSIQIVAAKLLTHLTTAHRAIVQPLAWSHIRQSLSLMDFLRNVDPTRAIIEACIISNLLPALPKSLHKKYVGPVKQLILSGLEHPQEGTATLSLVFQGLANLAKFEGWGAMQQSNLASDLLDMTQEIPKDSQHAALNAISRLLSVPTEGLEVYDLLIRVHATFGGRGSKLDPDLKALVSGIYGHLGTVERNPIISRDSKAAINRETSVYDPKARLMSQVAEIKDKYGADHQTHINWLVTKNLLAAFSPTHKAAEERAIVLEVMTSFGILQPKALPALLPDLPSLLFTELRNALHPKDGYRETTPVSAAILFLASALHISTSWLEEYWSEAADIMGEALKAGEVLPVLRGLGVILDAVAE